MKGKKITIVAVLLLLCVLSRQQEEMVQQESIILGSHDVLVLQVEAVPSSGYVWELGDMGLLELIEVREVPVQPSLFGSPVEQELVLVGREVGERKVELEYRRPWEEEIIAWAVVDVEVESVYVGDVADLRSLRPSAGAPTGDATTEGLPEKYDARGIVGNIPVRDQGNCGSCWAFATGFATESAMMKQGDWADLSEQYLVSCYKRWNGCCGGRWAFDHYLEGPEPQGGLVLEATFPYIAKNGTCKHPYLREGIIDFSAFVESPYDVASTIAIKEAILGRGGVAAAVCVNSAFARYDSGTFTTGEGCTHSNHAIGLVGWDDARGREGAWLLRNSWGEGWGEDGYMWIEYGASRIGDSAIYAAYSGDGPPEPTPTPTPDPDVAMWPEPEDAVVAPGAEFTITTWLTGMTSAGAWEIHYCYDPNVVQLLKASHSDWLESTGRNAIKLGPSVDVEEGTIVLGEATYGGGPGPDGGGPIVYLQFWATNEGSFTLDLHDEIAMDSAAEIVEVDEVRDGTITVAEPTPTSSPSPPATPTTTPPTPPTPIPCPSAIPVLILGGAALTSLVGYGLWSSKHCQEAKT